MSNFAEKLIYLEKKAKKFNASEEIEKLRKIGLKDLESDFGFKLSETQLPFAFKTGISYHFENESNTNIYKFILAIAYQMKQEWNEISDPERVGVRFFIEEDDAYENTFRTIRNMSREQIKQLAAMNSAKELITFISRFFDKSSKVNKMIQSGSDEYTQDNVNVDISSFEIFVPNLPEDIKGSGRYEREELKKGNLKNRTYLTKFICVEPARQTKSNDDCLIFSCKTKAKKNKEKPTKSVRKELNLPKGPLSINVIPKLEDYYGIKVKIITYNQIENDIIILYSHSNQIEDLEILYFIDTLSPNGHFAAIDTILNDELYVEEKSKKEKRYIGLDYETIVSDNRFLKPYCLYVTISQINSKGELEKLDEQFSAGFKCQQGLKEFLQKWDDKNFDNIIIGYNSSRFDNFFLLEAVTEFGWMNKSSIFFVKNSILDLRFKSFRCFDLCRYTVSTLESSLKAFNCNIKKIEFKDEHKRIQRIYNNGEEEIRKLKSENKLKEGLIIHYNNNSFKSYGETAINHYLLNEYNTIKAYNQADVDGMLELFFKTKQSMELISKKITGQDLEIVDYMTLSAFSYECFSLAKQSTGSPIEDETKYTDTIASFIRSSMFGGRAQINRVGSFIKHQKDEFCSLDVKSLYPFVMRNCKYPVGQYKLSMNPLEEIRKGYMGIYNTIIFKQPIPNIIPHRTKDSPLDWKYDKPIATSLTSVDIETLLKHGAEIDFTLINFDSESCYGIYWEHSEFVFEKVISIPEDLKSEQDRLASIKDKAYNPALRNMSKFFMNSLSGKVGQRLFEDTTEIITSNIMRNAFYNKCNEVEEIPLKNCLIMKGKKKKLKKKYKPWHLGCFIYSYSRTHMYNAVLSKVPNDWFATDTDSCHILKSVIREKLIDYGETKFGEFHMGGNFGDFEDELYGCSYERAYFVRPKCYGYFNKDGSKSKMRFKGISTRDKIIKLTETEAGREYFDNLICREQFEIYESGVVALDEILYKSLIEKKELYVVSSRLCRTLTGITQKYQLKIASHDTEVVC